MSRDRQKHSSQSDGAISIVGPGMTVVGDLSTEGTVRIEGSVNGNVQAGKAVVVGANAAVEGSIETQDAILAGLVVGTVRAGSRLEIQATCRIEGEVYARRIQLEEGAVLNGTVHMGDEVQKARPDLLMAPIADESIEGMVGRA
jgi:cytoskeletal protein CcmA (bactofilin family)